LGTFDLADFASVMFYLGAMISLNSRLSKSKIRICGSLMLTIGAIIQVFYMKSLLSSGSAVLLCIIIGHMPNEWAKAIDNRLYSIINGLEKKETSTVSCSIIKLVMFMIIIIIVALLLIASNWDYIKNDGALQGLIYGLLFSFMGAVIGGLIGGYGSYFGGINGAKTSLNMTQSIDRYRSRKIIIKQLERIRVAIVENDKTKYILPNTFFLIENWLDKIMFCDFDNREIEILIKFFQRWEAIEQEARERDDQKMDIGTINIHMTQFIDDIDKIIDKYK